MLALLLLAFAPADLPKAAVVTRAEAPAVVGLAPDCIVSIRRHSSGGSGTVVGCEAGKSLVLTNRHVCEGADGVTVEHAGKTYPAECVAVYAGGDLVLFSVEAELPYAEIAEDEPPAGAVVEQWGFTWHGQGRPIHRTAKWSGAFGGYDLRFESAPIIETGIVSESGDSGSAVFYKGQVVAVTWGTSAAVPLAGVRHFLRQGLARLFPRLAARIQARRAPMAIAQAPPGDKKPIAQAPPPAAPAPKQAIPQAPPVVWYYYSPPAGGSCPGGVCPPPRGLFGRR